MSKNREEKKKELSDIFIIPEAIDGESGGVEVRLIRRLEDVLESARIFGQNEIKERLHNKIENLFPNE